jgi:hypothetical protein
VPPADTSLWRNLRKGLRRISLGGVNTLPEKPLHSCNIPSVTLIPMFGELLRRGREQERISCEGSMSIFVVPLVYLAIFSASLSPVLLEDRICWQHSRKRTTIYTSVRYAMRPATRPCWMGTYIPPSPCAAALPAPPGEMPFPHTSASDKIRPFVGMKAADDPFVPLTMIMRLNADA